MNETILQLRAMAVELAREDSELRKSSKAVAAEIRRFADKLEAQNTALVEACEEIVDDLETDYIANPSHRAGVRRQRHLERIRAALAQAKGGE